jgi:hypothetical protein
VSNNASVVTDKSSDTFSRTNTAFSNDDRKLYQLSSLHQHQASASGDFSDSLLDDFDFDTECHFGTSFGLACLTSNPTCFGSPATNSSSTTSLPGPSSQIPEFPNAYGCDLPYPGVTIGFANPGSFTNRRDAGTCGTGNDHYAAYPPENSLEYLADPSIHLQHKSIIALARPDQHRLLERTPNYCQQAQHPLDSSALTSFNVDTLPQPITNAYDSYLATLRLQPTSNSVPMLPPLKPAPIYDAPPGPPPGLEHQNSFLTDFSDSKSNESDIKKLRRQRNSAAARKYRQKRLDRIEELEEALRKTQTERDELKVQVAQWKGKAETLQSLMARSGADAMERHG